MTRFNLNLALKKRPVSDSKKLLSGKLKPSSSVPGFKKMLFNKVIVRDNVFEPRYNRRKHSLSQDLILNQPAQKLNKMHPGFNLRRLRNCVAFSLRHSYGFRACKNQSELEQTMFLLQASTPMAVFVNMLESHTLMLRARNMISKTLRHAHQDLNHSAAKKASLSSILQKSRGHRCVKAEGLKHVWNQPGAVLWHA